jgi:hypothetical protein
MGLLLPYFCLRLLFADQHLEFRGRRNRPQEISFWLLCGTFVPHSSQNGDDLGGAQSSKSPATRATV